MLMINVSQCGEYDLPAIQCAAVIYRSGYFFIPETALRKAIKTSIVNKEPACYDDTVLLPFVS